MKECLVTIESVKIKDFIFSSNKLKVIRGASYLLDYLNQVEVPKLLDKNGVTGERILYVGAGNAKFFVDGREKAERLIEAIGKAYERYAPGAKVVGEYLERGKGEKVWELIDSLSEKIAQRKSRGFSMMNMDLPFVEKCIICNANPVEMKKNNEEILEDYEELYITNGKDRKGMKSVLGSLYNEDYRNGKNGLCRECVAKVVAASHIKRDEQEIGIYHRTRELERFSSGETIEDYAGEKSFVGFVYADGDGLGDFLSRAKDKYVSNDDEAGYREFMKDFSTTLDKNTKDAFIETLKDMKNKFPRDSAGNILYGEFLIVGGDDVCGIFSGDTAIEVSTLFQKKFEEKMLSFEERYRDDLRKERSNITASSGVVIAKDKTPLHYLFERSIELQKTAKTKKYEDARERTPDGINNGYIDFQVIGSEGTTDIKGFREGMGGLMERPYRIASNVECRRCEMDELLELIALLKDARFPRNKIRKFYELKREDENIENLFEFVNLAGKLDEKSREVLFEDWIGELDIEELRLDSILGNIFDVLEIYDFVGGDM